MKSLVFVLLCFYSLTGWASEEKLEQQKKKFLKIENLNQTTSETVSSARRKQELLKEQQQLLKEQVQLANDIIAHKEAYINELEAEIERLEPRP